MPDLQADRSESMGCAVVGPSGKAPPWAGGGSKRERPDAERREPRFYGGQITPLLRYQVVRRDFNAPPHATSWSSIVFSWAAFWSAGLNVR